MAAEPEPATGWPRQHCLWCWPSGIGLRSLDDLGGFGGLGARTVTPAGGSTIARRLQVASSSGLRMVDVPRRPICLASS